MEKSLVLCVEDDSGIRRTFQRLFRQHVANAELIEAETCQQAMTLATTHQSRLKVIVLDYSLEAERTLIIIPALRERFGPGFPLFSFSAEEKGRLLQMSLGCSEAFDKMDMTKLVERIRQLLAKDG